MKYGYFDDAQREYVITRPDTPLPWINYLGSERMFGLISNTAGGYSFYRDARLRRITRYRYNNVPLDTGGRCIYLRDHTTGEVLVSNRPTEPLCVRQLHLPSWAGLHNNRIAARPDPLLDALFCASVCRP